MINEKIMSNNSMITQADYMKYQEYISSLVDIRDAKIVYISGLELFNYQPIKGSKIDNVVEILKNGGSITEIVYFRDGDTYKQMEFTLDSNRSISIGLTKDVNDLDEITVEINSRGFLGNPEEYIKILRIQGKEKYANEKQMEYEYFINNREKIIELMQRGYDTNETDKLIELKNNGKYIEEPIEFDFSVIEQGKIEYKGITISDDGLIYGINEFGEITREAASEHIISEIEVAVKTGEIVLNEQQENTLLKAKKNIELDKKIGLEDFKIVAENSFEDKAQVLKDLQKATQEQRKENRMYNR